MPQYTQSLEKVIALAGVKAGSLGTDTVNAPCLLVALANEGTSYGAVLLKNEGLTADVIERTARNLFGAWQDGENLNTVAQPRVSREVQNMVEAAGTLAQKHGHVYTAPVHVLYYLIKNHDALKILKSAWLSLERTNRGADARLPDQKLKALADAIDEALKTNVNGLPKGELAMVSVLDQYTVDLTALARENKLDKIVGRKKEIRRAIEILGRQTKNNPVFIGEPGVGKTAIAEGLAIEIASGRVPKSLRSKRLLRLDLTALVAGTKYRGEFEERIKAVVSELKSSKDAIVFIDELHTLIGAGAAVGAMDAANILKPALARGELTAIGATTLKEYRLHIEKDGALDRRFQPVMVEPSSVDETIEILKGRKAKLEEHHGVKISDEALILSALLADRHIADRFLPDKAIDVVDEAASALAIDEPEGTLREDHITVKISQITGIKLDKLKKDEAGRLARMESEIHKRVIGQDMAISAVSRAVRRSRAGLKDPKTPIGNFLFLGPTGVGKTELARALQAFLFDDDRTLIRLDMSEFMERHSVSKLIGAPPGYVGYEEGGRLTEAVRRKPYSVVLLDEIEKAHPDVFNILLQVMDDGRLTDGQGRTVDFKNTIIIMTSNIAADKLIAFMLKRMGDCTHERLLETVMPEVRLVFRPEFLNRLDEVICFTPLSESEISDVLDLMLLDLKKRLDQSHKIVMELTDEARAQVVFEGYDAKDGARPMRRAVRRVLEDRLSEEIIAGRLIDDSLVSIDFKDGKLVIDPKEKSGERRDDDGGNEEGGKLKVSLGKGSLLSLGKRKAVSLDKGSGEDRAAEIHDGHEHREDGHDHQHDTGDDQEPEPLPER